MGIRELLGLGGARERPRGMSSSVSGERRYSFIRRAKEKPKTLPKGDPSVFGKRGYISHPEARGFMKRAENRLFKEYHGFRHKKAEGLVGKITNPKRFGPHTDPKDIEKYRKEREEEIKKIKGLNERKQAEKDFKEEMDILKDVFLGKK